jgi:hypothetical protein
MSTAATSVSTDDHSLYSFVGIEDSLEIVSAVGRLLGHMCGSIKAGRVVGEEELSRLQVMIEGAHDDIEGRWKMALEGERHARIEREEAIATVTAELTAERARHDAPGSIADLQHALGCWRLLRSAAEIALQECDKSDPRARSLSKKKRRGRAGA